MAYVSIWSMAELTNSTYLVFFSYYQTVHISYLKKGTQTQQKLFDFEWVHTTCMKVICEGHILP